VAKPRKPTGAEGAQPEEEKTIPSEYKKKDEVPEATFRSNATTVSVDVAVLDNKGRFIPNIPTGNFRVLEDNVPQKIETTAKGEAPMTVCLLIEFSGAFQWYGSQTWYQTLVASYGFAQTLKKEDYIAIIAYDMKPEILSDFSTDRTKTYEALQRLRMPGMSEANLFDALVETEERMENIEGRKAIVLLSSGVDTFSKLTFDKARKRIQEAGVPVFAIGLMQALRIMADSRMSGPQQLEFLQADNQVKTFSKETGGQAYFPRFYGEFPGIYQAISEALRNQYTFTYHPTNQARDGSFRRIKVELVNPATNEPLRVVDEKQKPIKYQIIARQGYKAPREVE
jgi:VWFA-related protein